MVHQLREPEDLFHLRILSGKTLGTDPRLRIDPVLPDPKWVTQ